MTRSRLSVLLSVLTLLAVTARGAAMYFDRRQREKDRRNIEQMERSPIFQARAACIGVCAREPDDARPDCEEACFQLGKHRGDLDLDRVYAVCKLACMGEQRDGGSLRDCANGCMTSLGKTGAYGEIRLP
jgi:hypothetical protein